MAEFLVRVVDKVSEDAYLNSRLTKRGDVIVVRPDGWVWSYEEVSSPAWRLVRIPGLSVEEAQKYVVPEVNRDPRQPSITLQRRGFQIDLDALARQDPVFAIAMADETRAADQAALDTFDPTKGDVSLDLKELAATVLEAVTVEKPPIPDRAIIGDDMSTSVIG